jgi:hypothetical protein
VEINASGNVTGVQLIGSEDVSQFIIDADVIINGTLTTEKIADDAITALNSGTEDGISISSTQNYSIVSCSASGDSTNKAIVMFSCVIQDGSGGTLEPNALFTLEGNNSGYLFYSTIAHSWNKNADSIVTYHFPVASVEDTQYTLKLGTGLINGTGHLDRAVISCIEFKK